MVWTQFWDMHSGGGTKEDPYDMIYIEAPVDEAEIIFYNRFGHNPNRITCSCCGEDYSIDCNESLEQLTGYHRNCSFSESLKQYTETTNTGKYVYGKYQSLEDYCAQDSVLVIYANQIEDDERHGELPKSGWVWHG